MTFLHILIHCLAVFSISSFTNAIVCATINVTCFINFLQLQYNLFGAFARKVEETSDKDLSTKRYFVCREVEDNYTKYSSTKNSSGTVLYC